MRRWFALWFAFAFLFALSACGANTEHGDGSKIPTLPINLGEYSLYFYPAA